MRLPAILLGLCLAFAAYAAEPLPVRIDVHKPALRLDGGDCLSDTLPAAYTHVEAHLRFECHPHRAFAVTLRYDQADSANYRSLTLRRAGGDGGEALTARPVELIVRQCIDDCDSVLQTHRIARGLQAAGRNFSLKLVSNEYGTLAIAGQDKEVAEVAVPFDAVGGSPLTWTTKGDIGVVRHTLSCDSSPAPVFSRFDSLDQLCAYLRQSDDPREGLWVYLDRDTRPTLLTLGGDYVLATVSDGDGYQLLYIAGAQNNSQYWLPLQVKGRLNATGFTDQYDLTWVDAFGHSHDRELSAQLTAASTLTLNFPLHKSKVRFRRLPTPALPLH